MSAFPQNDIPLIIQDRHFDIPGQNFYNLVLTPRPNMNVEPLQYRFRLWNGSNARFYKVTIPKVMQFISIVTDDGNGHFELKRQIR